MTTSDLLSRFSRLRPLLSDWADVTARLTRLAVDAWEWKGVTHQPPPTPVVALALRFLNSMKEGGFPPPDSIWSWPNSVQITWTFNYSVGCTDYIKVWADVTENYGVSIMISDGEQEFHKWEGL